MTNSTSERSERLLQQLVELPAGERIRMKCGAADLRSVITDLLSLLDSEAAGGKRDFEWALRELADGWIANNEREGPYGFNQNARRVLEFIANDAATPMRDKCVAMVGAIREDWIHQQNRDADPASWKGWIAAADKIAVALQSLTLEQEQPVKEESCCISALIESRERAAKRKLEQEQK